MLSLAPPVPADSVLVHPSEIGYNAGSTRTQPSESTADGIEPFPGLTIILPTRNEAGNIPEILRRLAALPATPRPEVLFVDDSEDDTQRVIEEQAPACPWTVRVLHRPPSDRVGGLGGAVAAGLRIARAPWVVVMDADLQHPPELIPALWARAEQQNADLVVASRYCDGGDAQQFGRVRSAISSGSTLAARALFQGRLDGITDPMSGFFLVRRSKIDVDRLRPCGFKILLEIVGRTAGLKRAEVPFVFGERHAGESKASLREGLRYGKLLFNLRFGDTIGRFAQFGRFGLVGGSGLVVNSLLLAFATELLGIYYLLAAVLATQGSTLWNFALSERWVFRSHAARRGRGHRAAMFFLMNNAAFGLRGPTIFVLTSTLGMNYLLSNLISLAILMVLRYGAADRWIWGGLSSPKSLVSPASPITAYGVVAPGTTIVERA